MNTEQRAAVVELLATSLAVRTHATGDDPRARKSRGEAFSFESAIVKMLDLLVGEAEREAIVRDANEVERRWWVEEGGATIDA